MARQGNSRPSKAYREQTEANREIHDEERRLAARYIEREAKRHDWSDEELVDVKGALGV